MIDENTPNARHSKKATEQAAWLWKLQPTATESPIVWLRRNVAVATAIGILIAWWLFTR